MLSLIFKDHLGLEAEDGSGSVGKVIPSGSRDVGCPGDYEEGGGKCIALAKILYYYIRKKSYIPYENSQNIIQEVVEINMLLLRKHNSLVFTKFTHLGFWSQTVLMLLPLSMVLAVGLSFIAFIMLRYAPFIPNFVEFLS